jgi:hypothetical protein
MKTAYVLGQVQLRRIGTALKSFGQTRRLIEVKEAITDFVNAGSWALGVGSVRSHG